MKIIDSIIKCYFFKDGTQVQRAYFPDLDVDLTWELSRKVSADPKARVFYKVTYTDGSEGVIPVSEILEVFQDRTAFAICYSYEQPSEHSLEKVFPWFMDHPNNVGVYNADCTFRFQVSCPRQDSYIFGFAQSSIKYPELPSVILSPYDMSLYNSFPELYALDPNSPVLIPTGQRIRD